MNVCTVNDESKRLHLPFILCCDILTTAFVFLLLSSHLIVFVRSINILFDCFRIGVTTFRRDKFANQNVDTRLKILRIHHLRPSKVHKRIIVFKMVRYIYSETPNFGTGISTPSCGPSKFRNFRKAPEP